MYPGTFAVADPSGIRRGNVIKELDNSWNTARRRRLQVPSAAINSNLADARLISQLSFHLSQVQSSLSDVVAPGIKFPWVRLWQWFRRSQSQVTDWQRRGAPAATPPTRVTNAAARPRPRPSSTAP